MCFLIIVRCITKIKSPIIEGQIRAKELSEYLDNLQAVKVVWISEDATAILTKVVYDPSTNQLIGIVLPIDKTTGCPDSFTFMATDAEKIKQHLMHERSNMVYLVMGQPLDERIPPFVIQMFGSSNKFDSQDVVKRWNFVESELKRFEFEISTLTIQRIFYFNKMCSSGMA